MANDIIDLLQENRSDDEIRKTWTLDGAGRIIWAVDAVRYRKGKRYIAHKAGEESSRNPVGNSGTQYHEAHIRRVLREKGLADVQKTEKHKARQTTRDRWRNTIQSTVDRYPERYSSVAEKWSHTMKNVIRSLKGEPRVIGEEPKQIGVKPGGRAWDWESRTINQQVLDSAVDLSLDPNFINDPIVKRYGIHLQAGKKTPVGKLIPETQIPGGVGSCNPDGGVWLDKKGRIIAAFEAKKQGNAGNAIDQWFKNELVLRMISPKLNYITFCRGAGADKDGVIRKSLNIAVLDKNNKACFNQYRPNENSVWLQPDGFGPFEIKNRMRKALLDEEAIRRAERAAIEVEPTKYKPKSKNKKRKLHRDPTQYKEFDKLIRSIAKELWEDIENGDDPELKATGIKYHPKLQKHQIPGGRGGCQPDGGVWMKGNKVVAAFEAKSQEGAGGIVNRWFKNHRVLRANNPNVTYGTFCRGAAARPGGPLEDFFAIAVLNKNNKPIFNPEKVRPGENNVWLSRQGFSKKFIKEKMREAILSSI